MPYTMEDLKRDFARELWQEMTTEERLNLIRRLTPEARKDVFLGMTPQEFLHALPPEFLKALKQQLTQGNGAESSP